MMDQMALIYFRHHDLAACRLTPVGRLLRDFFVRREVILRRIGRYTVKNHDKDGRKKIQQAVPSGLADRLLGP